MLEKRTFNGGVDKDTELRLVQPGDYRDALNIQASMTSEGSVGAIEKVRGNVLVDGVNFTQYAGDVCIGGVEDKTNQKLYYFLCNTVSATNHRVVCVDYSVYNIDEQITVIAHSAALSFNKDFLITGANVVDGLHLYWTDDYNEPSKIYLPSAEDGFYLGQQERQYFDAIPHAPLFPPVCNYGNNVSATFNNLKNKIYQFKHRYVYFDGTRSAFSPTSKAVLPLNPEDNSVIGFNSFISITFSTQNKNNGWNNFVKSIEIAARSSNGTDFQIIHTEEVDNQTAFIYQWDNTSASKPIAINESNLLFNFTPLKAKSQELLDSNRIGYGNILEGYDNIVFPSGKSPVLSANYTGQLAGVNLFGQNTYGAYQGHVDVVLLSTGTQKLYVVGNMFGTEIITIKLKNLATGEIKDLVINFVGAPNSQASAQATIVSRLNSAFTDSLGAPIIAGELAPVNSGGGFIIYNTDEINDPVVEILDYDNGSSLISKIQGNPLRTWKRGTSHEFGIVYYDRSGRSSLVQTWRNNSIKVENPSNQFPLGKVNISLNLYHQPPEWAHSYQVLYRGDNTYFDDDAEGRAYYQFTTGTFNVTFIKNDETTIQFGEILSSAKNKTNGVVSYGFTRGDRVKLIGLYNSTTRVYSNPNISYDFEVSKFDSGSNTIYLNTHGVRLPDSRDYIFEIYTPLVSSASNTIGAVSSSFFYEIGEVRRVLNAGTYYRTHESDTNAQQLYSNVPATVNLNSGNTYLKNRVFMNYDFIHRPVNSLPGSSIDGFHTDGIRFVNVEEAHYMDFQDSNDFDFGRVNVVDKNFKQTRRNATVRYSDVYIPDTNINGLGTFFDVDFVDYEKSYGSIQKFYAQDKKLLVFQELKVGQALINESTLKDTGGQTLVQKSDQVLSDIQYYNGDFGISDCPESFAVYGFAKYFVDKFRGAVLRLSNDGINKISDYKMHTYFTDLLRNTRDAKSRVRILGVYNEINSEYILSVDTVTATINRTTLNNLGEPSVITRDVTISPAVTWAFSEASNRWTSRLSFTPEMMLTYGIDYCTFKDGGCWLHNYDRFDSYAKFYDTQYASELEVISNMAPSNVKFFKALSIESNEKWEAPVIINQNNQESELLLDDFEEIENVYYAALLGDKTTPNVSLPLFNGDDMRGNELIIKLKNSLNTFVKLFSIGIKFEQSELTNK